MHSEECALTCLICELLLSRLPEGHHSLLSINRGVVPGELTEYGYDLMEYGNEKPKHHIELTEG